MKKKLIDCPNQSIFIVSHLDSIPLEQQHGLERHGIYSGAEIIMIKNNKSIPVVIESRNVCIVIDKEIAKNIDVELKDHV